MKKNKFDLNFLGIGAQRCGTTWISQCLAEHPQICISHPKEVSFFGTMKFRFGLSWYKKHFSPKSNQILGEFNAGYHTSNEAAHQIKTLFPDIKIIISLRNPINRVFSNYLSVASFEARNQSFETWLYKNQKMIDRGLYYTHLKKYFELFPKKNILIVLYEDIAKNPVLFMEKIFRFLGVNPNFIPKSAIYKKNYSKSYKFPFVKRIIGKIVRFFDSFKFGVTLINLFRKIGGKKIFFFLDKINSQSLKKYPSMSKSTQKKLAFIYQPEIDKLQKLIDCDLSAWK